MKQQDIVWIEVPYSKLEESKIRPALIVSKDEYNSKSLDVIICAITSNIIPKPHSILISQKDISKGKLPIPSKIKIDKIMQVEKKRITKSFARLDDKTFDNVTSKIMKLISRT